MKFTFNWGTGIVIAYMIFGAGMLTLVYKTTQVNIDLVSKDYYAEEVAYESRLESIRNANKLASPIRVYFNKEKQALDFSFPKVTVKEGAIKFFRPSDASQDQKIDLALATDFTQSVPTQDFQSGHWRLKIEFEDQQGKRFYDEQVVYLP